MSRFATHDKDSAPAQARAHLDTAEQGFGFVPNLIGKMAESPALAEAYLTLSGIFDKTDLSPAERQVVLLAVSRYNECHYCVAAHSMVADMSEVPAAVTEAIRNDHPAPDPRLEALRQFTTQVVDKRGWVSHEDVQAFLDAGFEPRHVMDVIVGVGLKTLSNYTNHIAETPLDEPLRGHAWSPQRATG